MDPFINRAKELDKHHIPSRYLNIHSERDPSIIMLRRKLGGLLNVECFDTDFFLFVIEALRFSNYLTSPLAPLEEYNTFFFLVELARRFPPSSCLFLKGKRSFLFAG
ncbi:MAG: hypothetical protein QXW47_09950 [Candidatus Jordarchaeales archaeon]|nr:hypothetical protein [Candidatus Jordarchaeia archaeon]